MSSEIYFGEVDCRRIENLQCAIEQLTAALVESQSTSTNNARDEICADCNGSKVAWMEQMRFYKFVYCPHCGRKLSPVA